MKLIAYLLVLLSIAAKGNEAESLTPSDQVRRRLQRGGRFPTNNNNGGFPVNNNNGGSSAVSTLTTVNAQCSNGQRIQLTTCSNAAKNACDGQYSCYYPITTQNSPECGSFATYSYTCYNRRRLQRGGRFPVNNNNGGFPVNNNNGGSSAVSTLTTVNANCGSQRIQLTTCSNAAKNQCNGQYSCYYPITTQNSPECGNYATYSYTCYNRRRLQRHGGRFPTNNNNGGFPVNNNNNGGSSAVSTLYNVNANCNGLRIQTTSTCSNAARSACDGQYSCSYAITTQNSPECGNFASYYFSCY